MKIQMLTMMFIAALAFSACSDDDKNEGIKVPDAIAKALVNKYPSATGAEWEKKGDYFVADCWNNGQELDVWFKANAIWVMTETNISWDNVPGTVQTAFNNTKYANWKREDIDILEYSTQPIEYVIKVEQGNIEYQLFYSEEGGLIDERNIAVKDDTHWPK